MIKRTLGTAVSLVALVATLYMLVPGQEDEMEATFNSGDPMVAAAALRVRHSQSPEDLETSRRLVAAYERANRPADALAVIAEMGRRGPLEGQERQNAHRLARAAGKPALALAVLAGPHETLTPPRLAELVALALEANRPNEAQAHQAALANATQRPAAFLRLRTLALANRDGKTAIAAQRRLLALAPSKDEANRLADLLLGAGDPGGALTTLERAGALVGAEGHQRGAQLAEWAGDNQRADGHLAALWHLAPSSETGLRWIALGRALKDPHTPERAREVAARFSADGRVQAAYQDALVAFGRTAELNDVLAARVAVHPTEPQPHQALLDFYLQRGMRPQAITELTRFVAAVPGDRPARHQLAQVQAWEGRMREAWAQYATLFAKGGSEHAWRAEWLGISRPVDDATTMGRANLNALVAAFPERTDWWRRLAYAELEAGERRGAIVAMRCVVQQPAGDRKDKLALTEWLFWDKQLGEGLAWIERLRAEAPIPEDLHREAVELAAHAERWGDVATLVAGLTAEHPRDAGAWEMLAVAREANHDIAGACSAWRARLALDGGDATRRSTAAVLHMRLGRPDAALALLSRDPQRASVAELRFRASIASSLNRTDEEAATLKALLTLRPADTEATTALASALTRMGRVAEADALTEEALQSHPENHALALATASVRAYGPNPASAKSLIARIEAWPRPGPEALRLLADYYQSSNPSKAALALDRLHAIEPGDAGTWFRRGELARAGALGDAEAAFTRAAQLGKGVPDPELREAAANSLERLNRFNEAEAVWASLSTDFPGLPAPHLALLRARLAQNDLDAAAPHVAALLRISPRTTDMRIALAEYLRASGHSDRALAELAGVKEDDPDAAYAHAASALAHHDLGQFGLARLRARQAVVARPGDQSFADAYRLVRDAADDRVGVHALMESYSGLSRSAVMATGLKRWGDRLQLEVEAGQLGWDSQALVAQQASVALEGNSGPWHLRAQGALASDPVASAVGVQSPTGALAASYIRQGFTARLELAEARWEELDAAVRASGRESKLGVDLAWQVTPHLGLRALGSVGQLRATGLNGTLSSSAGAEATYTLDPTGPWGAAYQIRHRYWGAAGPAMGLPESLPYHNASLIYAIQQGPFHLELQPGVAQDLTSGEVSPTVGGSLSVDLGLDAELAVTGNWSDRALAIGNPGAYQNVEVSGRWSF